MTRGPRGPGERPETARIRRHAPNRAALFQGFAAPAGTSVAGGGGQVADAAGSAGEIHSNSEIPRERVVPAEGDQTDEGTLVGRELGAAATLTG
ncbi:hypothetical protein STANM309S_04914 [Streptomyces tanashiensis]